MTILAAKFRWLEPAGQLIVLAALGFQFFQVNPVLEASTEATSTYIQALLEQHTLLEHPRATSGPVEKASADLIDAQATAKERKAWAVIEKRRSSKVYIRLFILGSLMVIIGKLASVAYSTKATLGISTLRRKETIAVGEAQLASAEDRGAGRFET